MASAITRATSALRFDRLDALRAIAMVWMAAFHLGFDLNYFALIPRQNFYGDPLWTVQRACIVSLFVFCAGIGQAVAWQRGHGWRHFWERWAKIVVCALLVTAGSMLAFPRSYISFGVLHGIALMLIVTRLSAGWGPWLWLLGLMAMLLPQFVAHPVFDTRYSNWVGLVTRKPVTEDYAPLLPWVGVMGWGMASGQWLLRRRPRWLGGSLPAALRPLASLGRWPLTFYMLHQRVLIGVVWALATLKS
jgi:uncharacterized membrane protein